MKLAIISDIHGNLPALQAVLHDIEQHQPDAIFCCGDLVNFGGWDNEVTDLIRSRNILCTQGNHDEGIGNNLNDFPFSFKTEAQKEFQYKSIEKTNQRISEANRKYLSELPFMLQVEFRFGGTPVKIAMVHGSISSNKEYVRQDAREEYLLNMMNTLNAQVLIMGHTHIPYYKKINSGEKTMPYHVINAGSVGKPGQGNNLSCYCLLHINRQDDLLSPVTVRVDFQYVPYDVHEVIRHLRETGMSDAYDMFLLYGNTIPEKMK